MCGIAGYVQRLSAAGADNAPALVERMLGRLAHRGPDGSGVWTGRHGDWQIVLGQRRLAIIDLEGGAQPMGNEDGAVQVTFNGEICNHQDLRLDLERRGHRFRTRSDTESIVHQLEEHRANIRAGIRAFDGMFAFALWDGRADRLVLARDRAGIKPLYYAALPDGGLAFASELTSLMAHPAVGRDLDPDALASYFFMDYAHAPGAILKGVRKLEPAHLLTWSDGGLTKPERYWSFADSQARAASTEDHTALVARLRTSLEESVVSQLESDVPIGVFLSGGIDSSLVAALAARHVSGGGGGRLKTFTIRVEEPEFDQSGYARLAARHIGTDHIEEPLNERSLLDSLDDVLNCLDEPLADPSIVPTYAVSRVAAAHVKVVLGGDGADELWAGYPTCKAHALARLYGVVPGALRRAVVEPLVRRLPIRHGYQSFEWKARRFALRWDDRPATRHLRWMSSLDAPDLASAIRGQDGFPRAFAAEAASPASADPINDILRLDFSTYMPGAVLAKVDRAAMAHGLEVRPPMLANRMIDLAFGLPSSIKFRGRRAKALLKEAAAPYLPPEIIHRPKMGFAIPLASWLRGPLRDRLQVALQPGPLWETGLLTQSAFLRWEAEHNSLTADRSRPLWALLVLDHWLRRTLALGRSTRTPALPVAVG